MKNLIIQTIRAYLSYFPVTDGKGGIYNFCKQWVITDKDIICNTIHGFKMMLDLGEPMQNRIYWYRNYDEKNEALLVKRFLKRGDVFYDIGANVGFYSLLASTIVGLKGSVVSFEPSISAFSKLKKNIEINRAGPIHAFNFALGSEEKEGILYSKSLLPDGCASLIEPQRGDYAEKVRIRRLDTIMEELKLPKPDFVKIDVEGYEVYVIKSASHLLSPENAPMILIEMTNNKKTIIDNLRRFGYFPAELYRGKWYEINNPEESKSRNLFWYKDIHKEKLNSLIKKCKVKTQ